MAKQMLHDVLQWFPTRKLVLLGDGAYSANNLLVDLDERVDHVGVMRGDAAIYDPVPPKQPKSKRGPKPQKGLRLPSLKQTMKKADRNRSGKGPWSWQCVEATAYGVTRRWQVVSFQAPQHWCQQSIERLSPRVWLMPMGCRLRRRETGNPTGMHQDEQTVGGVVSSRSPQNPQLRIFP